MTFLIPFSFGSATPRWCCQLDRSRKHVRMRRGALSTAPSLGRRRRAEVTVLCSRPPPSLSGGLLAWERHSGLAKRFFEGRGDLEGGLFCHRALQFGLSLIGAPVGVLQAMEPVPILLGDTIFAAIHVRNILAHTGPWLKTAVSSFEEATPRGGVGPPTACCLLAGVGRESRQQGNNTPRWPPAGTASAPGLKREAGESPARSRHCDRGANPRDATGTGGPGKARGSGDPGVRRPASGVREPSLAYRRAARGQPPAERRRLFL